MCYLIAKNKNSHGCYAFKTKHGKQLVEMKKRMNMKVANKGIQLVTISRPTAILRSCTAKKPDQMDVFTEEELPVILKYLINHLDSLNIGILLMFLTGIRVGELVALKHTDFDGNSFKVQRTETRYSMEKGKCIYEVSDFPKTEAGIRTVVFPREYSWVIDKIKKLNPFGEYIFVTRNRKRVLAVTVRKRLYLICDKLGFERKSLHKIRKTYGSILLDRMVDQKLITELMGHTNISCTENFYHKDRKNLEKKIDIISNIPEFMAK